MPITVDSQSQNDFLYIHITGKLTDDDYKNDFLPALKKIIDAHGHVNALIHADENFSGWTLHAMWDDAHFGWLHRNDFQRVAFVGDMALVDYGVKISNWFMKGEMKSYKPDELEQALAFVKG